MEVFLETTVRGLGTGALYTLLGLGFVIVFKSTHVINFAQPAIMIFGAFFASALAVSEGLPWVAAVIIAVLLTAAIGGVVERVAMRPMVGAPPFSAVMVTIGVFFVLQTLSTDAIGLNPRSLGDPFGRERWDLGGVAVQHVDAARIGVAVVVVALLTYFFKYTRNGLALRATAFSTETALAQGVPVGRMFSLSWIIAGAIAGLAGVFLGAGGAITGTTLLVALKALPAIVIGGLDSIPGAIAGGAIIGLAEAYTNEYQEQHIDFLGQNFDQVVPYVVLLVVLLVRPYGLFGTRAVERV